jgi:Cu/Ag efflux protein CusF
MKSLIVALALMFSSVSFAAEPSKSVQKQTAPAKKQCDMLKDKNCDKAPPSANKPVPKKKKEAK